LLRLLSWWANYRFRSDKHRKQNEQRERHFSPDTHGPDGAPATTGFRQRSRPLLSVFADHFADAALGAKHGGFPHHRLNLVP
jgi:hypothetical protein